MRFRRTGWIGWIACGLFTLLALEDGRSADHGDGRITLDVTQSLIEGPPYAALPVEMDAGLRHPPDPVIPAGQIQLVLVSARDTGATGGELPMLGTMADNGDPFGEPGDEAMAAMRFTGVPPNDDYPLGSRFEFSIGLVADGNNITEWELHTWLPSGPGKEQSYSVDVVLADAAGQRAGEARLNFDFEVAAGQDLVFSNPSITAPVQTGPHTQISLQFDLDQTGGAVDPAEPIFSFNLSSEPVPVPAIGPAYGPILFGLLLLGTALVALRMKRRPL